MFVATAVCIIIPAGNFFFCHWSRGSVAVGRHSAVRWDEVASEAP